MAQSGFPPEDFEESKPGKPDTAIATAYAHRSSRYLRRRLTDRYGTGFFRAI